MSGKTILFEFLAGFCFFCAVLVVQSGVFDKPADTDKACILLQQTAPSQAPAASPEPNVSMPELKSIQPLSFVAEPATPGTFLLGSTDPNTGYKFALQVSTEGAAISKATFSEFDDRSQESPQPLVILAPVTYPDGKQIFPLANREFVFVDHKLQLRLDALQWDCLGVEKHQDGCQKVTFVAFITNQTTGQHVIKLTKSYKVMPDSYLVNANLTIENLSDTAQNVRFNFNGPLGLDREGVRMDMRKLIGGFRDRQGQITITKIDLKKFRKAETDDQLQLKSNSGNFLWAAATNKYFSAILVPTPAEGTEYCQWLPFRKGSFFNPDNDPKYNSGDETVGLQFGTAPVELAPAGTKASQQQYDFRLYLGPKDKRLFDHNEYYRNLGFIYTIDFMSCCCPIALIRPLAFFILWLMNVLYSGIPNYGIVIIILVFIVRIVLHPVTKWGQVRMNRFTKILSSPEVQEIRKKYAKSQLEMQKRISEFQKSRGVSPADAFIGMLPMMVQLPLWVALWSSVNSSIDLRGAAFLPFWITDLSVPDALFRFAAVTIPLLGWKISSFNLLPILMGVAFYLQQKAMPQQPAATPEAAQQQKIMKVMMLVMFPILLYNAPSGVNLYIMASSFAGAIEQNVIRKHIKEKEQQETGRLVEVTSKTGGKVKKKKPKPFFKQF